MQPLRARLQDIKRLLQTAEELELSSGAVLRLRWFEFALTHSGNVSLTCRHFGIARSTFARWAERFDAARPATIEEKSRRPINVRKPETDPIAIGHVRSLRQQHPNLGKHHIQRMLQEQYGVILSTSTVGRIIARHRLFFADTTSHEQKRSMQMEVPDSAPARTKKSRRHEHHDVSGEFLSDQPELGLQLS